MTILTIKRNIKNNLDASCARPIRRQIIMHIVGKWIFNFNFSFVKLNYNDTAIVHEQLKVQIFDVP